MSQSTQRNTIKIYVIMSHPDYITCAVHKGCGCTVVYRSWSLVVLSVRSFELQIYSQSIKFNYIYKQRLKILSTGFESGVLLRWICVLFMGILNCQTGQLLFLGRSVKVIFRQIVPSNQIIIVFKQYCIYFQKVARRQFSFLRRIAKV